jgi:hypothetical protein
MKNIFLLPLLASFATIMMPILASLWFFSGKTEAGAIFMLAWAVLIASWQICAELRATREK